MPVYFAGHCDIRLITRFITSIISLHVEMLLPGLKAVSSLNVPFIPTNTFCIKNIVSFSATKNYPKTAFENIFKKKKEHKKKILIPSDYVWSESSWTGPYSGSC
jgi:hypothetical protein